MLYDSENELYRNPNWHDTIPDGTGIVWMSMRTFKSDNSYVDSWSSPRQMTDTANFQVEFTTRDLSTIPDYKPTKFTGDEST